MLTIAQCREFIDPDTSTAMSDEEVVRVRDDLYTLARLVLEKQSDKSKLLCQKQD